MTEKVTIDGHELWERRELSDEELAPLIQKAVADVYGHCGAPPSNKVVAVVRAVLQAASAKIS